MGGRGEIGGCAHTADEEENGGRKERGVATPGWPFVPARGGGGWTSGVAPHGKRGGGGGAWGTSTAVGRHGRLATA
jgi:hypothetical protein